ncbi:hypothetical protein DFJ73DRAFT_813160 [Zopfochytrium polystomum]|nr:hypothetical protein DFJ73DRAFT_813160 [Zopfochytrium polystomum]
MTSSVSIPKVASPYKGVLHYDASQLHKFPIYALEIAGTRPSDGSQTGVYRSIISPEKLTDSFPNIATLYDVFQHGLKLGPNMPCFGHRPTTRDPLTGAVTSKGYVWQTYRQISERRINFGCGLNKINEDYLRAGEKFHVAIYAVNRPEWMITDLGAHLFSCVTVALYDTLGPDASQFIINHSDTPVVVASIDKVPILISLAEKCPKMKAIISMDGPPANAEPSVVSTSPFGILRNWAAEKGILLFSFFEVETLGMKNRVPFRLPQKDDLASFSYTSGTTGQPKAAMIRHGNLVAGLRGFIEMGTLPNVGDVHLSYLPLAHVYERIIMTAALGTACAIGFSRGDVKLLIEDIGTLRPTIFVSVPRLLNRVADAIMTRATTGSALAAAIFKTALQAKLDHMDATGQVTHPFWDALVFNKVKNALGGRVQKIGSGSAPISSDVKRFLRVAFGVQVLEGYGQTENCAASTISFAFDYSPGNVGSVVPSNEIKLVAVPEMNYHPTDKPFPRGEIWQRGANIFAGYYKDEAKTREALTEDGWLKTGDIGYIDERGRIYIIDRKKNIFKLSQGEYVAPEKLENVYIKCPLIAQSFVHGDSLRNELVAVVVLDQEHAIPAGVAAGILPPGTPNPGPALPGAAPHPLVVELSNSKQFTQLVLNQLVKTGKESKLRGFELVKAVRIVPEQFSLENGLLTPTFKLKRNEAVNYFRALITDMYNEIEGKAGHKESHI